MKMIHERLLLISLLEEASEISPAFFIKIFLSFWNLAVLADILRKPIHLTPRLVELRAKFFPPHMILMSHPDMIPALLEDFRITRNLGPGIRSLWPVPTIMQLRTGTISKKMTA